jgi:protein-tyrosine phosphatase
MLEKGLLPSLAGSRYYLFELPDIFIKDGIIKVLRQLTERDIIPILAHPERNHTLIKNPGMLADFAAEKTLFQVTGDSVLGKNGRISHKMAKAMIRAGQVHFIASDGHDADFRKPVLNNVFKAVKKISNEKTAKKIMMENPKELLDQAKEGNHMGKRVG